MLRDPGPVVVLGSHLADVGEPAELFLSAEGDSRYQSLNVAFPNVYFRPGLERPLKPAYIRRDKQDKTYRIFVLGASAAVTRPGTSARASSSTSPESNPRGGLVINLNT